MSKFENWLRQTGFDEAGDAFKEIMKPFKILGAQALYITEPFGGKEFGDLARRLERISPDDDADDMHSESESRHS
ncbi:MAG: hypothetical protein JXA97_06835 [Anaerolineales bacterium]|nr:hypothetical protein [Anaerolineales bacterium]